MTSKLAEAISLAALAHDGQEDKSGEPYVLHVMRVMCAQNTDETRIIAALHDVVEDTTWTIDGLRALGFSDEVLAAVDAITKRKGEKYWDYLLRVKANPLATRVKLRDISDNRRDIAGELLADRKSRLEKYTKAIGRLISTQENIPL